MKQSHFEGYLDHELEGAECTCSPRGLPHSKNCKLCIDGQDTYELLAARGKNAIEAALAEYDEFLKEEREDEIFWNALMKEIVVYYEKDTGQKWEPGSNAVKVWIRRRFTNKRPEERSDS